MRRRRVITFTIWPIAYYWRRKRQFRRDVRALKEYILSPADLAEIHYEIEHKYDHRPQCG